MKRDTTLTTAPGSGAVAEAFVDVQQSFERLCLAAGMEAFGAMMEVDVEWPAVRAMGGVRSARRIAGVEHAAGSASMAARWRSNVPAFEASVGGRS